MSSKEFAEWEIYDSIEPIGERRADDRLSVLCAIVAAAASGKSAKPNDFIPEYFWDGEDKPDPDAIENKLLQWAGMRNKAIDKKKNNQE